MNNTYKPFQIDPHVHTIISGHSWSTVSDYVKQAIQSGVKGFCLTEHGPATPNGPPEFFSHTYHMIPNKIEEIRIYKGVEANILSFDGELDIKDEYLCDLDFCIASIHSFCLTAGDSETNTNAYLKVLSNPYIDMIGHPDDPRVPCDLETLVLATKQQDKIIELNNSSLTAHRKGCQENVIALMKLCKKYAVRICVSSDAHFHTMLGQCLEAQALLDQLDFPAHLIINRDADDFDAYIQAKKIRMLDRLGLLTK
jgi:putative hydrolase